MSDDLLKEIRDSLIVCFVALVIIVAHLPGMFVLLARILKAVSP
jgi:hypothetical protein